MELQGKKVILIAPEFFGCDLAIERALLRQGAKVFRIKDRPFSSAILKALTTLFTKLFRRLLDHYYISKIEDIPSDCDFVLVINGQTVSRKVLNKVKEKNKNAKFVLYVWDSFKNRPTVIDNIDIFDRRFSFEKGNEPLFNFRPLFFEPKMSDKNYETIYSASFIGTVHTDRYSVINKIDKVINSEDCFWYLYLQSKWVFYWYKLTKKDFSNADISNFKFTPISISDANDIFMSSEIIVDVEHPAQKGLTIRTLEVLGAGKKLVTTNRDVINYDFYKYGNVCVIDRLNPEIPQDFFDKIFKPYPLTILNYYSIDSWLTEVLSDE